MGAHWLQDCPTQGDPNYDRKRVRPPVGIPMTRLARSDEGGLVLPDGNTGTLVANEDAWAREIMGLGILGDSTGAPEGPSAAGTPVAEAPAPVLALDSVPAEVRQAEEAKTAAAAAGPVAIVPPIMAAAGAFPPPKLAGDDEHGGGAPGMPGSSFFDLYMRSALLPRGPPAFVEEAFKRDAPLRKSEFERLQDSYRRRFNLSPVRRRRSRSRSRSRSRRRSHRSRSRSKDRSSRQRHSSRERERDSKRSRSEKEKEEDKGKSKSRRKDDVKERSRGTDKERDKDRKERDKETSKARKDGDKKEERGSKGDTKQDADAACAGDTKAEVGAPGTNERLALGREALHAAKNIAHFVTLHFSMSKYRFSVWEKGLLQLETKMLKCSNTQFDKHVGMARCFQYTCHCHSPSIHSDKTLKEWNHRQGIHNSKPFLTRGGVLDYAGKQRARFHSGALLKRGTSPTLQPMHWQQRSQNLTTETVRLKLRHFLLPMSPSLRVKKPMARLERLRTPKPAATALGPLPQRRTRAVGRIRTAAAQRKSGAVRRIRTAAVRRGAEALGMAIATAGGTERKIGRTIEGTGIRRTTDVNRIKKTTEARKIRRTTDVRRIGRRIAGTRTRRMTDVRKIMSGVEILNPAGATAAGIAAATKIKTKTGSGADQQRKTETESGLSGTGGSACRMDVDVVASLLFTNLLCWLTIM